MSSPLNILHVTQGYFPAIGGTERVIQRVSEELVEQFGDHVTVFTTNCYNGEAFFNPQLPRMPTGWEEKNGVRIERFRVLSKISQWLRFPQALAYRLKLPGNEYLRAFAGGPIVPGLGKAIREFTADIIAASSFPLLHMFASLKGAQNSRRPCVLIGGLHPDDDWGYQRRMIYRAIQQTTRYIAYTEFEAKYVVGKGALADRVRVSGVGVDPKPFETRSLIESKESLGLGGKPLVGFIGQLGGHKGADTVIRAMPLVWQALPDARLLIAGARTLFATYLEELIHRLPVPDQRKIKVIFDFPESEKPKLFAAVDVFAYPSGFESFGISFLEAWSAGKPVIGCRCGAVPCVVDAGRDGLLVDYQNEGMLAEAILLLLKNPYWAQSLGNAGRNKVHGSFTWPIVARRFREVYLEAIEMNQATRV